MVLSGYVKVRKDLHAESIVASFHDVGESFQSDRRYGRAINHTVLFGTRALLHLLLLIGQALQITSVVLLLIIMVGSTGNPPYPSSASNHPYIARSRCTYHQTPCGMNSHLHPSIQPPSSP
jgi:hypothetical protein